MIHFTFFGSSLFSIYVLDELARLGLTPRTIVTTPDKPQGRKLTVTPNVVKTWALRHNSTQQAAHTIKICDPAQLDQTFITQLAEESDITHDAGHVFIVASYGKIIPQSVLDIPARKTLNIHPSLLPHYRGASPLQAAILNDTKNTGITIMRIDEQMDHGPVVAQREINIAQTLGEWPTYEVFEEMMARAGARLLAETLPDWVAGNIPEKEQDHAAATYTKKSKKEDGLIDLTADPYLNFRKIQAYHQWPQAYFVINRGGVALRVKVTAASFSRGALIIERVIPEGSKEMSYADFESGFGQSD